MTDNKYITEEEINKCRNLSQERLDGLKPKYKWGHLANRPQSSLVDLMHWVECSFGKEMPNTNNLGCWIHNKIIIDGDFLTFAEENEIKIECLIRDSIASWSGENDSEQFVSQGVFLITTGDLSFLHAGLFHKGNQNEDEVSFFIVMRDSDYNKYLKLRNKYETWLKARDRQNLEIHIVGHEGSPYSRDAKWEDLFLPNKLKEDIVFSIEGFLNSKELYDKKDIPWKKGILLYGDPGNGKSTLIRTIISNYDLKPVTVRTSPQTDDNTITEAFLYAQEQGPSLLFFEDLDSLLGDMGGISLSHFLNLMDGVSSKEGILVMATANDLDKLNEAILDRPSRFDRKFYVPLPDKDMAKKYLKKWYGDTIKPATISKIAGKSVENNFSYAYLKELYITSAYYALAAGREDPILADINKALEQLLYDKENAEDGFKTKNQTPIGFI